MLTKGSLRLFMNELVILEQQVADLAASDYGLDAPRVYRWKPRGQIELPASYNWLAPSPAEYKDVSQTRRRDSLNLSYRVAVAYTDADEEMAKIEGFADAAREVLDAAFRLPQPLNDTCKWAERPSMSMASDEFDGASALCIEFTITAQLDRWIEQ